MYHFKPLTILYVYIDECIIFATFFQISLIMKYKEKKSFGCLDLNLSYSSPTVTLV